MNRKPLFSWKVAGVWFDESATIERMTQSSSAIPAMLGNSSETHSPLRPRCLKLQSDARIKKLEESVPFYEQAIQRAPGNQYYPYQGLASVYYQLNRYDKAAGILERWLVLHPDDMKVKALFDELRQSLSEGVPGTRDTAAVPEAPAGSEEK